jgi:hypothetical protein
MTARMRLRCGAGRGDVGLHFAFQVTHLEHFPRADALAQTLVLAGWLAVLVGLLLRALWSGRTSRAGDAEGAGDEGGEVVGLDPGGVA